jgi:hypothetical protein
VNGYYILIFMKGEIYMEDDRKHACYNGCSRLNFSVVSANRPPVIDADYWAQAAAVGEVCGQKNSGHIEVSARGLVPLGVYTLFFATDRGPFPAAPIDADYTADGFDPNRLIVNGNGVLNYYIAPLNFNPFKGIPVNGGIACIQGVSINFHGNRTTNGLSPGDPNVTVFTQLVSPFCLLRE